MVKAGKSFSIVVVLALVLSLGAVALPLAGEVEAQPIEVWVDDDWAGLSYGVAADGHTFGITAFATIQDGIDAVTEGGMAHVADGTYTENVDVNKSVTIQSENGSANCTVQAADSNDHVFEVTTHNVTIGGFTVENATGTDKAGIYLGNVQHCNVSSNNVTNNDYHGMLLDSSSNNILTNNTAWNNGHLGIALRDSDDNTITNNTANSNKYGILLNSSSNNTLTNNTANSNNYRGIWLSYSDNNNLTNNTVSNNNWDGIYLEGSSDSNIITNNTARDNSQGIWLYGGSGNNILTNNTASNNDMGIYLSYYASHNTLTNNTVRNNYQGIRLWRSDYNTLTNNTAWDNTYGIRLSSSSDNNLTSNTVRNNWDGIDLDSSSNNTLTNNTVSSNNDTGIYLNSSSTNDLINNTIQNNDDGIYLDSSDNNTIYNNYFNNTNNAFDDGNNIWNTTKTAGTNIIGGPYLGGNYWSDYTGTDTDGDGLGDTVLPYNSGGNIVNGGDYLPLVPVALPVHNINTGEDFATIQAAIDAGNTTDGHTIRVDSGNYTENVDVYKQLTIISTSGNPADTIVQAADPNDHVFELTTGSVNITGFTVTGAIRWGKAGICLGSDATHCNISSNNATNNRYGIYLDYYSSQNTLTGNNATDNSDIGIYVCYSSDNTLSGNAMWDNTRNFGVYGWSLPDFTQDIDTSNKVNGKAVQYLVGRENEVIDSSSDVGYLGVVNCTNITIKDLTMSNNHQGVLLAYSDYSTVENVTAWNNYCGIYLYQSANNTVTSNNATNNSGYGIHLCYSSNNTLTSNNATGSQYGIYLKNSSDNTLTANVMSDNNYNFGVMGSSLSDFTQDIDISNKVNGKAIQYLVGKENRVIDSSWDVGYLGVIDSSNVTINDLTLSDNFQGLLLAYSTYSQVENVAALNNTYGIHLIYSSNNTLTGNSATNNMRGIQLRYSCDNALTGNNATDNGYYGIYLSSSSVNSIYLNNFIDNGTNVYPQASSNTWNSPEEMTYTYNGTEYTGYLGNHWSDYAGSDDGTAGRTAGDGIGDTSIPYATDGDGDSYPLIEPFENYPTWNPWDYDKNGSGFIEIGELLAAINDYIGGKITISQLLEMINLYISHTPKP